MKHYALSKSFKLGIDPNAINTGRLGIVGRTGSGKTNTAVVLAEQMIERGVPIAIVDPQGDWWGLRSKFSIAILGGEHGDVPLEATGGAIAADFLVNERIPVLLDLFTFGEAEMVRFATDLAKRLWAINRQALHVFLDEADLFAPQRATADKTRCLGAWQNICRRGRSRGLGLTMLSQRTAVINKDLLTQADPLIVHRMTAPQDLNQIDAYLEHHGQTVEQRKEILRAIAGLERGEAYVISPGELRIEPTKVAVMHRRSFDSSATPTAGQAVQAPRSMADVDLSALQKSMAATIEQAKQSDPKFLQKRVAELESQLRSKGKPAATVKADPAAVDRLVKASLSSYQKVVDIAVRKVLERLKRTRKHEADLRLAISESEIALEKLSQVEQPTAAAGPAAHAEKPQTQRDFESIHPKASSSALPPVKQRILNAIAWWNSIGVESPDRGHVALLAGYQHTRSKGFTNALSELRTSGLLSGDRLTPEGIAAADPGGIPQSREDLHAKFFEILTPKERGLLQHVIENHVNHRVSRSDLMAALGYEHERSKGFTNTLSHMRSMGFIDYEGKELVVATSLVFPEGLT